MYDSYDNNNIAIIIIENVIIKWNKLYDSYNSNNIAIIMIKIVIIKWNKLSWQ